RMLSYTYVTDLVRQTDDMKALRGALDAIRQGIILLDADLNIRFMNGIVRTMWGITDAELAGRPSYPQLVRNPRHRHTFDVPDDKLDAYIERRIAQARDGDPTPVDLHVAGRVVRATCAALPGGGRMLTYSDVTDLVHHAEELDHLATTD